MSRKKSIHVECQDCHSIIRDVDLNKDSQLCFDCKSISESSSESSTTTTTTTTTISSTNSSKKIIDKLQQRDWSCVNQNDKNYFSTVFAVVTLFLFFGWASFAPIILGVWAYFIYNGSLIAAAIAVVVLSSGFWPVKRSEALRRAYIWRTWAEYFSFQTISEVRLESDQNYLFCCSPHGVFPMGLLLFGGVSHKVLPEINPSRLYGLIATVLLRVPILAPILRILGACEADKSTIEKIQKENSGASFVLVPGGIAEIFYSDEEQEMVFLKERKGFCKLALRRGLNLVPVYVFGHTQLLSYFPGRGSVIERWSRRWRVSLVQFYGSLYLPIPRPRPLVFVIGPPIQVEKIDSPSQQQIDELHSKYLHELIALYERHKINVPGFEHKSLVVK